MFTLRAGCLLSLQVMLEHLSLYQPERLMVKRSAKPARWRIRDRIQLFHLRLLFESQSASLVAHSVNTA